MVLSNTVKVAFASALGAILVSSTLLFPLIKDLNHTITKINSTKEPVEKEYNKTVQIISKDQDNMLEDMDTRNRMTRENPSIEMKRIHSVSGSKTQYHDTALKSNILKEDIPHHKGN